MKEVLWIEVIPPNVTNARRIKAKSEKNSHWWRDRYAHKTIGGVGIVGALVKRERRKRGR